MERIDGEETQLTQRKIQQLIGQKLLKKLDYSVEGNLHDPWKNPYLISYIKDDNGPMVLQIRSAGPDRRYGTDNDVISEIEFSKD